MRIQVLGPGCHNCKSSEAAVREAVASLGITAEIVKVTDYLEIAKMGVMKTPALAIDGKVVISGRVPTAAEVAELLKK
jgi:small redox-active disulfide protein 2